MLKLPNCIITKIQTLQDRSLKISLETRELTSEEMTELFESLQQEVDDLNLDILPIDGKLTPSERLRNVLYVRWQQKYEKDPESPYKTFPVYYESVIEKFINHVKENLEPK